MASFVTHLESAIDGTRLEARVPQRMHAGRAKGSDTARRFRKGATSMKTTATEMPSSRQAVTTRISSRLTCAI